MGDVWGIGVMVRFGVSVVIGISAAVGVAQPTRTRRIDVKRKNGRIYDFGSDAVIIRDGEAWVRHVR